MSNDNKVLSQEEIDAMLAGGSDDGDDEGEAEIEAPSSPPVSEAEAAPVAEEPAPPVATPVPVAAPEPEPAPVAAPAPAPAAAPEPVATPVAAPAPVAVAEPAAVAEPVTIQEPAAPPPAPSTPAEAVPEPVPVPPAAAPVAEPAPTAAAADVQARGVMTERIDRLEAALADSNKNMMQMHQEFQTLVTQVQLMGSRMEGVLGNLKSTLGYRAQKTFTCASCETDGNVAAKVQCTKCGKENWWGWWPQSE